jgi:hypothetical protein
MDVEIDNLEIKTGVDNEKRHKVNPEFQEAQLELLIEKCVERFLKQMMSS